MSISSKLKWYNQFPFLTEAVGWGIYCTFLIKLSNFNS